MDDDCSSCYLLVTSSAVRGNIPLILCNTPPILIVKVPNYNCFTFTQRLITIREKEKFYSILYIASFLLIAIHNLSNRGILQIVNLSVLTSSPSTE
jgi:hypothetical protein